MPTDPQSQEQTPEVLSPAAKRLQAVQTEILARRNVQPQTYTPPPVPAGIAEKTRLEIEEGQKRVAMAEAQKQNRPAPKKEPDATTTTPVYRPADFVPNMSQGQNASKSYKAL